MIHARVKWSAMKKWSIASVHGKDKVDSRS